MLLLFLVSQVISNTYTEDIDSTNRGFHRISDEYNKADINVASGQFLMLVEWEDAVIEINFPDDPILKVTFTKEIGLSLFTFKSNAKIHMEFITGVSYYNYPCK